MTPAPVMVNGQPNPTGTGPYCLAVCYCGGCPHYAPLPPYDASHVQGSKDWARKTGRPVERPRPPGRRGR